MTTHAKRHHETVLLQWFAADDRLQQEANLVIVGGRLDPAAYTDQEEAEKNLKTYFGGHDRSLCATECIETAHGVGYRLVSGPGIAGGYNNAVEPGLICMDDERAGDTMIDFLAERVNAESVHR